MDAQGIELVRSQLIECDLEGVRCTDADLNGRRFERCSFRGDSLQGANLTRASFVSCELGGHRHAVGGADRDELPGYARRCSDGVAFHFAESAAIGRAPLCGRLGIAAGAAVETLPKEKAEAVARGTDHSDRAAPSFTAVP